MRHLSTAPRLSGAGRPVRASREPGVLLLAMGALVAAEALLAFVHPFLGALAYGLVLLALLLRWVSAGEEPALALALVPLGRLTALALTPKHYGVTAYVLTGLPLLVAVLWALRSSPLVRARLGTPVSWHAVAVAFSGVPLGWAGATLVHFPVPGHPHAALTVAAGGIAAFVFAGVLEELLFRGLVQGALERPFGAWAVVLTAALSTAVYLPTGDARVLIGMAAAGLAWGWYVRRSGGLAAVAVAHGFLAGGALFVWPGLM
jgi:membrane protease YdiL (CAAX protease family)